MSLKVVSFKDTNNTMDTNNTNNLEEKRNHFYETDNIQIEIEQEQNEQNEQNNQYLKNSKPKIKRNPNAVSYDDILNSLGFGVSNGTLYHKNTTMPQSQSNQASEPVPLDPRIKNSPVYNKYFKNYKDPNEIREPEIPLTREQLRAKIIRQYIESQEAKKRISQIKSKKMFYSTQNISISNPQNPQNPVNLNKLFMFSNRK